MARELTRLDAIVVMLARSEEKLRQISASLNGQQVFYMMDVTSSEQVTSTIQQVIRQYGRIDILINNAGYGSFERLVDTDLETMNDMMDVNYMGTVRCIKAVLPHMLEVGSGNIVNIASIAGRIGTAKSSGYCASKHAVLGSTNALETRAL